MEGIIRMCGKMEIDGCADLSKSREMTLADIAPMYDILARWARRILPETVHGSVREKACHRIIEIDSKLNCVKFPFANIA